MKTISAKQIGIVLRFLGECAISESTLMRLGSGVPPTTTRELADQINQIAQNLNGADRWSEQKPADDGLTSEEMVRQWEAYAKNIVFASAAERVRSLDAWCAAIGFYRVRNGGGR